MSTTELRTLIANVRADLFARDASDRKCSQLGSAKKHDRPANWRPFRAAILAEDLFTPPTGW